MNKEAFFNTLADLGGRKMSDIGFWPFFAAIGISLLCALFIAFLYVWFYQNRTTGSMVHRSFPLLGVSITAIFITIQFSLPLSLGLLGALSIVRFRTPIKEPEEIGFIMLVVAEALCCATFNIQFLALILVVAVIGLVLQAAFRGRVPFHRQTGLVVVTVPPAAYEAQGAQFLEAVQARLPGVQLESVAHVGDETHLSWGFRESGERIAALLPEIEKLLPGARTQIFCHRVTDA